MRQNCMSRQPSSPTIGVEATVTGLENPFQEFAIYYQNLKSVRKERELNGPVGRLDVLNWSL